MASSSGGLTVGRSGDGGGRHRRWSGGRGGSERERELPKVTPVMAKPLLDLEDNVWLFTDNSLLPLKAVVETLKHLEGCVRDTE